MSTSSLTLSEYERPKATRGIAHLLSPGPAFRLHSSSAPERDQVKQYVSDQFQEIHGATIRDFMPLLLTMSCDNHLSAAVGIRPAQGQRLFLEQYLSETVEKTVSRITGQSVERGNVTEIGNLVATKRGSSQLLFLILTAVLQATTSEWLVFTATPGVQKSIRRLGFRFHTLGDADPSLLDDPTCLKNWGSYYEGRPQVVAGSLSEAMVVLSDRKVYKYLISHYQSSIDALVATIKSKNCIYGMHSLTA
jgi:hypothetical protein